VKFIWNDEEWDAKVQRVNINMVPDKTVEAVFKLTKPGTILYYGAEVCHDNIDSFIAEPSILKLYKCLMHNLELPTLSLIHI